MLFYARDDDQESTRMVADAAPSPPINGCRSSFDVHAAMDHVVHYKDQVHRRGNQDGHRASSSSQRKPRPVVVVPPPSSAAAARMTPTIDEPPIVTDVQLVEDSEVAQLRKEAADQAELVRNLQRQNTKSRKL